MYDHKQSPSINKWHIFESFPFGPVKNFYPVIQCSLLLLLQLCQYTPNPTFNYKVPSWLEEEKVEKVREAKTLQPFHEEGFE